MTSIVHKTIEGESNGDGFGHAVSLSSDGSIVAISAPNNEGTLTSFDVPNFTIKSPDLLTGLLTAFTHHYFPIQRVKNMIGNLEMILL